MTLFARFAALVAVLLSTVFLTAQPSQAVAIEYDVANSMSQPAYTCTQDGLFDPGSACITFNDMITVRDQAEDGKSVGVYWKTNNGAREGICRLTQGIWSYGYCQKSFGALQYRIGTCNQTASSSCTQPYQYSFFTGWRNHAA